MESLHYDSSIHRSTATELPISLGPPIGHGEQFAIPNSQNQPELTTIDCHSSNSTVRREIPITITKADADENPTQPPPFSTPNQSLELFVSPNSQNQSESTAKRMGNSNHDVRRNGHIATSIQNEQHIADRWHTEFHTYQGILYLLYAGALVVMFPTLTQLLQLKFQNNKLSPFETLGFFANTAVVAYTIAVPASLILFYMKARLKTSINERTSPTYYVYTILKGVFCFFGILAPLAFVLVLLIPLHV